MEKHAKKFHPIYTAESGSSSGGSRVSSIKTLIYVVYKSIRTVVFCTKLNLLLPFGPAAILVQELTDQSVSCSSHWLESFKSLVEDFFCLFVLRWIIGLGLHSKLSGYSTFGWTFRLCYRVRISVSLSLKNMIFFFEREHELLNC